MSLSSEQIVKEMSAGVSLRHVILNKLTPIMLGCSNIEDQLLKNNIEKSCKDIVNSLETLIGQFNLDNKTNPNIDISIPLNLEKTYEN